MPQVIPRLSPFGRALIVERVAQGRPVAHVAAELGVSRQTAYRWVRRYRLGGSDALFDRSSRPRRSPNRTTHHREAAVLAAREQLRQGPLRIAAVTGVPARTVSRILVRHGVPRLEWCDPVTGELIRASRATTNRYERERPGELVHIDVKKLGRIPDGGGWRAHGRSEEVRGRGIGFDYVHTAVDDHTRLAYAEIHPDERGVTAAGFLIRAVNYFASHGITRVEGIISDNAFAYRKSHDFGSAVAALGLKQLFIKPHCPWQNGKVERFNRTLAQEWAYRQPFTSNSERAAALAPFLEHYNTDRIHTAHGQTPASRVSPT
ncbi:IS481 family transposase [Protaetiibacter mangrovi]|uniref:IS481 family transposase n=1 Tax=Protaetiibacter mangrovi TaxID=2970926 RepID=A0ABT1ZBH1_9MICO|nr:IS481 family transposase [Protaetiibacter mangrovi]MCS0498040.1 IS481 family transposase [Protaetiibacter mangrovi]TPX03911.1 IS481 family transposase [Schumannella luteola]